MCGDICLQSDGYKVNKIPTTVGGFCLFVIYLVHANGIHET
jgi:hypothetical protein